MNSIARSIFISALVVAPGCDSAEADETKAAVVEQKPQSKAKEPQAAASPAPAPTEAAEAEAPAVEVSDPMKAFMSALGEHDQVTAALKKHGAAGLEADMGQYDIQDPMVSASEPGQAEGETCYAMNAKTGAVRRKFEVCWTGDKITRADNKGLQL